MRFLIFGKNCYTHEISDGRVIHPVLAGHPLAFTRPLISRLLADGHNVALISSEHESATDARLCGSKLTPPNDLILRLIGQTDYPKVALGQELIGTLDAVDSASSAMGGVDWVLFVYAFPSLLFAPFVQRATGARAAAFLRGGDGYKYLSPDTANGLLGESVSTRVITEEYRRALQNCDRVFAVSRWLASRAAENGIVVDDVVPAFTPTPPRQPRRRQDIPVAIRLGRLDTTQRWLVTAGRMSSDKNLVNVIAAFESSGCEGWQLILLGDGPERDTVCARAAASRRSRDIIIGSTDPDTLAEILLASDAYVHGAIGSTEFRDSRPSSVLAACSAGLPIVFFDDDHGVHECVSSLNRQLLACRLSRKNNDASVLAMGLRKLRDSATMAEVGKANRIFSQEFSGDNIMRAIYSHLGMECVRCSTSELL